MPGDNNNMNNLVYNPVTGMFEDRSGGAQPTQQPMQPVVPPPVPRPRVYPPTINTFQRRGVPVYGKKCKFVWNVSGATSLHVTGYGELPVSPSIGSCMIDMTAPNMEITLTASNEGGTVRRTLKVNPGGLEAVPLPIIKYFRKMGNGHLLGDELVLEWDVDLADKVFLEGPRVMQVQHQGTSHVHIEEQSMTYKLRAVNIVGREVTQTVVVELDPPNIRTFASSSGDNMVNVGDVVTITWDVENCQSLSITSNGISDASTNLSSSGTMTVRVTGENPEVVLVAHNGSVENTGRLVIHTTPIQQPVINDLNYQALALPLYQGERIVLKWETQHTDAVRVLDENRNMIFEGDPCGSRELVVNSVPMNLILVARNMKYFTEKSLSIVALQLPSIDKFECSTDLCKQGGNIDFTWETSNTDRVTLDGRDVPLNGSETLQITTAEKQVVLKASNGTRTTEKVLTVKSQENPQPVIKYFRYPANADRHKYKKILLEWDTTNAQKVELKFGKSSKTEEHPPKGSRWFEIKYSRCNVTLIAHNGPYTAQKQITIEMEESLMQKIFGK